jgi:hypothetical protein
MDKANIEKMIEEALKQRIEYMKKMAGGIMAQADMYSVNELSGFMDTIFNASDESKKIMEQSLAIKDDKNFEEIIRSQDSLVLIILLEALELRPIEQRFKAEQRISDCTKINSRLRNAIQAEIDDLKDGDNFFEILKNSEELNELKKLLPSTHS